MLRSLGDVDKNDLMDLLAAIDKTFSLYWRHYPPYHKLQDRSSALDAMLHDKSTDKRNSKLLLIRSLQRLKTCILTATTRAGLRSAASGSVAVPRTTSSLSDRSFAGVISSSEAAVAVVVVHFVVSIL